MYLAPAKVQVIQEKPVCNGATTGTIKLKIRAIHETLNAILDHKNTKIYFRFVGEDGNPVKTDYSYTLRIERPVIQVQFLVQNMVLLMYTIQRKPVRTLKSMVLI